MSQPPRRRRRKRSPFGPIILVVAIVAVLASGAWFVLRDSSSTETTTAAKDTSEPLTAAQSLATTVAAETLATTDPVIASTESTSTSDPAYRSWSEPVAGKILQRITGKSWKPEDNCPVPPADLRLMHIRHWTFQPGQTAVGEMIVNKDVVDQVRAIFQELFDQQYPIERMRLVDEFRNAKGEWADDTASIDENNTSAFNCRPVTGGSTFSQHSYGTAIDINPIQNPYVLNGSTVHPESEPFLNRKKTGTTPAWRAVIRHGDDVFAAFAARGWEWGGDWANPIDYQHFSRTGK